jgi:cytochrome c5
MFFKPKKIVVIIAYGSLLSCSSPLYKPTIKNGGEHANLEELKAGRKIYIKKCSSCHTLILPGKYDPAQWKTWITKMEERAKLDEGENNLILKYMTNGKNSY